MDQTKFSNLLIKLRKERDLTQQDFAKIFDVSFQAVSKWEKGETTPDISILKNISEFYNISINSLINGDYEFIEDHTNDSLTKQNSSSSINNDNKSLKKIDRKKFSDLLVTLRKEKSLTQHEFAKIFNVSFQAVSKWENGESFPDISILEQISEYYNISINKLLNGNSETEEDIKKEIFTELSSSDASNTPIKKNKFKIIWCSISIILAFLFTFLPLALIGTHEITFYEILFSGNFRLSNFVIVIDYILFITQNILGIISTRAKERKVYLLIEETFATFCFTTIYCILAINISTAVYGLYFMTVLFTVSWITLIFSKRLNYSMNINNHLQHQLDRIGILFIGFIFFIDMFSLFINESDFTTFLIILLLSLAYLGLYITSIVFYCKLYTNSKNKKLTKLYFIFLYSTFSLFLLYSLIAFEIVEIISSITAIIVSLFFELLTRYRNKRSLKTK